MKTRQHEEKDRGGFGNGLASSFHREAPPTLVGRTARDGLRLAITEVDCDDRPHGFTEPIAEEDAFLIGLQLRGVHYHELWLDSRPVRVEPIAPGTTHFYDLARSPIAFAPEPSHPLFFYMPRAALAEQAHELGLPQVGDLLYTPGRFVDDAVIRSLGLSMLPVLRAHTHAHQMFVDHTLMALRTHLVVNYGVARAKPGIRRVQRLSKTQERIAKEMMDACLSEGIDLFSVATACAMDATRFVRAFRSTTGRSPHAWMTERRLHRAVLAMCVGGDNIEHIAYRFGFLSAADLDRVFLRKTGVPVREYRKRVRDDGNGALVFDF